MTARSARTAFTIGLAGVVSILSACPGADEERTAPEAGDAAPSEQDSRPAPAPPAVVIPQLPPPPAGPAVSIGATTTEGSLGASSTPIPGAVAPPAPGTAPTPGTSTTTEPQPPVVMPPAPAPEGTPPPPATEVPPAETTPPAKQPPRSGSNDRPRPAPGGILGGLVTHGEIVALEETIRLQRTRCEALRSEAASTGSDVVRREHQRCRADLGRMQRRLRELRARR